MVEVSTDHVVVGLIPSTSIILLTTDHEVTGSILSTSTNFKCGLGLERVSTQPREDNWVATQLRSGESD